MIPISSALAQSRRAENNSVLVAGRLIMNFSIDTAPPVCPYCQGDLPKRPTRKSRCPLCGETILVKYSPIDRVKRLITEAKAEEIDRLWQAFAEGREQERRDRFGLEFSLSAGMDREEQLDALKAYVADSTNNIQLREQAALHLARAIEWDKGKPWALISYRLQLEYLQGRGFRRVVLRAGPSACRTCQQLNGSVLTIEDAISENPVPNQGCANWKESGVCCSSWLPKTG